MATVEPARDVVRAALHRVAPDADLDALAPNVDLAEALGLDSLDFVRLLEEVRERTGIEIPEHRLPEASTIAGLVRLVTGGGRGTDRARA